MARRSENARATQAHQEVRQRIKVLEAELAKARQETKRKKTNNNNNNNNNNYAHTISPGRRSSRGVRRGTNSSTGNTGGRRKLEPVVVQHRVPPPGRARVHVERILRGNATLSILAAAEDSESGSESDDSFGLDSALRLRVQSRFQATSHDPSSTHKSRAAGANDSVAELRVEKPVKGHNAADSHRGGTAAAPVQPSIRDLHEQRPKRWPPQPSELIVETASPSQRIQASARPDIDELYTRLALLTTSPSSAHATQSSPSLVSRRDGKLERGSRIATSSPLGARRSPQRNSHNRASGTRLPGLAIPPVIMSPQRARAAQRGASSTLTAALKLVPVLKALHCMAQKWQRAWLCAFMKRWQEACVSIKAEELFLNGQAKILQRVIRERLSGPALAAAGAERTIRENSAAMRLGAAARGFLTRKQLMRRHLWAVSAQRTVRGHLSRRRVRQMLRMALISCLRAIAPRGKLSLLPNILSNEARFSKAMRSKLERAYRIATSTPVASGTAKPETKRNLSAPSLLRKLRRLHRVCIDADAKNQQFLEREAVGYTASISARRAAHQKAAIEAELQKLAVYRKQNAEICAEQRAAKRAELRREALKAERLLEERKIKEEHSSKRLQELEQRAAHRKHKEVFVHALTSVFDWGSGIDGNPASDPVLGYSFFDQPTLFSSGFILHSEVAGPAMNVPQAGSKDLNVGAVTLPSEAFTLLKRQPNALLRVLAFISSVDDVSVQSLQQRLRAASAAAAVSSEHTAARDTLSGTRAITDLAPQPIDEHRLVVWLLVGTMEGKVFFRGSWPRPANVLTTLPGDSCSSKKILLSQHVTNVLQGMFSPKKFVLVRKVPEITGSLAELVHCDEREQDMSTQGEDKPSDNNGALRQGNPDGDGPAAEDNTAAKESMAAANGLAEEGRSADVPAARDYSVATAESESFSVPVHADGCSDTTRSEDTDAPTLEYGLADDGELHDTDPPARVCSSQGAVDSIDTSESEAVSGPSVTDHHEGDPNPGADTCESARHQDLDELSHDEEDDVSIQDAAEENFDEEEHESIQEEDEQGHDEDYEPIEDDHELSQDEVEGELTEAYLSEAEDYPPNTANLARHEQHEDDGTALTEMELDADEIGSDDEFDVDSENNDSDFDEDDR